MQRNLMQRDAPSIRSTPQRTAAAAVGLDAAQRSALIAHVRAALPDVVALYMYGSRVRGGVHATSDLDVALLLRPGADLAAVDRLALAGDLAGIAGCPVDLAELDLAASMVFCKEVVSSGVRLFETDPIAVAEFEMRTMSQYVQFCQDRAPVVAAYSIAPKASVAHG